MPSIPVPNLMTTTNPSSSTAKNERPVARTGPLVGLFIEVVEERFCGHIISSHPVGATQADVDKAKKQKEKGRCTHRIRRDEGGWMYDLRYCATCGAFLDFI